MSGLRSFARAFAFGLGATSLARSVLATRAPGGEQRWARSSHDGTAVSLLEGPAVTVGLASGILGNARCNAECITSRQTIGAVIAITGAGLFGMHDDLSENPAAVSKGLKGHFAAARHGELTTGFIKILGIGATALLAAAIGANASDDKEQHSAGTILNILINAALIAGTANLLNLFDLRPGRALKVALLLSALPAHGEIAATSTGAILGASAAAAPADLRGDDMLGDGGANTLGALVGIRLAFGWPQKARLAALAAVMGLTLASEKVSFTKVIANNRYLNAIDQLGRV